MKEGQQHLFCLTGMHLDCGWASLALLIPQLGLFFGLQGVITEHYLVHSNSGVQPAERVAAGGGNKLSADLDWLLFLLI